MTILFRFISPMEGQKPCLTHRNGANPILRTMLLFLMSAVFLFRLSAQTCVPQADFTFTSNGCEVDFQPSYSGPGPVTHLWTFQTTGTGFLSTSDNANPHHTFGSGSILSRTVSHTITIGGVVYTCTKQFNINCTEGCSDKNFGYAVNGCMVSFDGAAASGQNWDFGDGSTSTQTDPTHLYAANGDYVVTYTPTNGTPCSKTIRVACGTTSPCCSADFAGEIVRECSILKLKLDAGCKSGGTHTWTISPNVPNACITVLNFFQGAPTQDMIQITNINTCVVSSLTVTHQFTCSSGTVLTQTKTLNFPVQGIFIGKEGFASFLTDYECVLPGSFYNQSCVVYSSGVVKINKNFNFSSADVRVNPGDAGFNVESGFEFTIRQNTIMHGNTDSGCRCLWRGIQVATNGKLITGSNPSIEDALYAIRAGQSSTLEIKETNFRRNFIGIRSTEGPFTMDVFEDNDFDGTGPLYDICGLSGSNDIKVGIVLFTPLPYLNERGFAGMYFLNAGSIDLLTLNYNTQNTFHDLAVGIDAYDSEINIRRNCRFEKIHGGSYSSYGEVALRFTDTDAQGVNGIRFTGNGKFATNPMPDIKDCTFGVSVYAEATSAALSGTRVSVTGCRILNVGQGVYLSTSSGSFIGKTSGLFRGVFDNLIQISPTIPNGLYSSSGIYHQDFSPIQSGLEFSQNTINVDQNNVSTGGSTGITAIGSNSSGTSNTVFQLDINRNEININQGFIGVFLSSYARAWVHDNSNRALPGTGIFLNYNYSSSLLSETTGIVISSGGDNLVGCNDITSNVTGTIGIRAGNHLNGTYVRNNINNGLQSVRILGSMSTGTRFACNTMTNYAENGLRYMNNANTGPQGVSGAMTHGNKWVNSNPALFGAFAEPTVVTNNSLFYVRTIAGENPNTNTIGWFFPNVPNSITPTCYYSCPITAPQNAPAQITAWDDSLATGGADYIYYPEAARWMDERNLYEKLVQNPSLVTGNIAMEGFMTSHQNTAMARLVTANNNINSLFAANPAQQSAMESHAQTITGLLMQLDNLDSLVHVTTNANTLIGYKAQRDSLQAELESIQTVSESLAQQLTQQRLGGIPAVLAYIGGITPTNVYEANEKTALRIYLQSVASGTRPSLGMLDTLHNIGSACPYIKGPIVYVARNFYQGYTGIMMPDVDCPEVENRTDKQSKPFSSNITGIMLYPNPADDVLMIHLPRVLEERTTHLTISNALGEVVLESQLQTQDNQVLLGNLPSGVYFTRITWDNHNAVVTSLFIQH